MTGGWERVTRADAVLACVLSALALLAFPVLPILDGNPPPMSWGTTVDTVGPLCVTLPLALRRRFPVVVFAVMLVMPWASPESDAASWGWAIPALLVGLYTVAAHRRWFVALAALAATGASVAASEWRYPGEEPALVVALALSICAAPVAGGVVARWRRLRRRARAIASEREAWDREQRAVAVERARIARELHDVVAHHVSSMVVSASAAHRVFDADPELGRAALAFAAATAADTTEAMHRLLGVLHDPDTDGGAEPDAPPLHDLDRVVERFRRAGCAVALDIEGDLSGIPADVDLTAVRIVQEGLTNTLKHAGAVPAAVAVRRTATTLGIRVTDGGPDAAAPPPRLAGGHGLVGMRERVAVFGGSLSVGPVPEGGWVVDATLPLAAPSG